MFERPPEIDVFLNVEDDVNEPPAAVGHKPSNANVTPGVIIYSDVTG